MWRPVAWGFVNDKVWESGRNFLRKYSTTSWS
jgi:hypothetical protein